MVKKKQPAKKEIVGAVVDNTGLKHNGGALRESEERVRAIFDNFRDGILVTDVATKKFVFGNQTIYQMLGYAAGELMMLGVRDIHSKRDLPEIMEVFEKLVSKEIKVGQGIPVQRKDGSTFYADINAFPIDLEGKTCLVGVFRDITERKQAEEVLRESEEQLRAYLENAPDGVYIYDFEGTLLYSNRRCEEIIGYKSEEIVGSSFRKLKTTAKNSRARAAELLQDNINGKGTGPDELELVRKDGCCVPVEINTSIVKRGGQKVVLAFIRDISARKKAEVALRESEQSYRQLAAYHKKLNDMSIAFAEVSNAEDLFNKIAEDYRLLTGAVAATFSVYNQEPHALKVVSLSIDPVSGDKVSSIFGPGLFEMQMPVSEDVMDQMLSQVIRRPKDLHELSFGVIPQDISDALMDAFGCRQIVALAINCNEELIGTCIAYLPGDQLVVPDEALITYAYISGLAVKRRRAEEALRESEAHYRLLAEHTTDFIWIMDMDLNPTYQSPSAEKLTGFSHEEFMILPIEKRIMPESLKLAAEVFLEEIPRVIADPGYNPIISLELEICRRDGTTLWSENKLSIIRDQYSKPVSILGEARDITERKKTEVALRESEERFRRLSENAPDVIYRYRLKPVPGFEYISPALVKYSAYTPEEFYADPKMAWKILHPEDRDKYKQHFLNPELFGMPFILRWMSKDGHVIWAEEIDVPVYSQGGELIAYEGIIRDFTARKQFELALQESEEQYRLLSEHTTDSVWLMDMDLKTTYHSPSVIKIRGFTPQEIIAMPLEQNLTPESLKLAAALFLEELPKVEADPGYNPVRTLELEYYCKDGTLAWAENKFSIIRDQGGKPVSILGESRDITDRRKTEEALKASETLYRLLSEHMTDTVWLMDMDLKTTYQSPSVQKVRGYTPREIMEMPLEKHVTPGSFKVATDVFLEEMAKLEADPDYNFLITLELEFYRKNGASFWSENTFSLIRDKNGRPQSILGEGRDITQRRKAEEAVRESEERFRNMANLLPQIVFETDVKGNFTFVNRQGFEMFGYGEADIAKGMNVLESIIPEDRERAVKNISLRIKGEEFTSQEYTAVRRDGSKFPVAIYAAPIILNSNYAGMRGMLIDITERKQAEEAVRESEKRFKSIVEHITDIFYMQDMERKLVYLSPQVEQMLGYTMEEMQSGWLNYLTDNPLNLVADEREQMAFATGEKQPSYILEFIGRDGKKLLAEINESPLKNDKGEVIGLVGAARDITERNRIQAALKESEEKYRMVVENSSEAIFIDVDGILKFGNRKVTELTGYSQEEYLSGPLMEFIHPDDRRMVVSRYLQRINGTGVTTLYAFRIVCKSGSILWVEVNETQVTWEGSPASLNFMTDITDRKRLEEEQQRVEKLESVGLLAGGIAHDFNNILTAILGNISLARMDVEPGSGIHDSLEQAEKASLRAKELTQQLLTFSKGGAPVKKITSLGQLLRDTAGFVLRGSNVKCHFSIPADLWHAEIDAGQVSQVIHNLVLNALQAMPTGGGIELTAENMTLSETQSLGRGLPLKGGDYIRITVADHGTGIPGDHLEKIFDPFFTTKHKGSGLGLTTSFSIARNHGGHLSVESQLGSGTTFYFYLPASAETATPRQDKKEEIKPAGKARVLVMDDEEAVRKIAGRLLKHIGYVDVEFAADGREAVKLYKTAMESGHPFNVVIMDLTIPGGMGGDVAVRELLKIDPGVKAIVSSGYADKAVMADYKKYGFSGVVAKPYTLEELRKAVHDVIG